MSLSINIKGTILDFSIPRVMGILNVTTDSFYDGGKYIDIDSACAKAEIMVKQGASIIDIGGYSSRPGALDISVQEELDRVIPVIERLSKSVDAYFSVDTFRSDVAKQAVDAGAHIVNDISSGDDDEAMLSYIAQHDIPYIAMHKQGRPQNMQDNPEYRDVSTEVYEYLLSKITRLRQLGAKNLIIDPGFGFGKTLAHNYELLNNLQLLQELNCPILCGVSRKSMINKVLKIKAAEALNGTSFLHAFCLQGGASILRVHDVKEAVECIKLWQAVQDNP